jgi:hypothetical protein
MTYELIQAHGLSIFIVVASMLITPFYILATYVYSGASPRKGIQLGVGFTIFGAVMFLVCLSNLPGELGLAGNLIVPLAWVIPSLVLIAFRNYFIDQPLSQQWIVGLQVFRAIGGIFLIEMFIGNQPGIFAYPAGVGDIIVAIVAVAILFSYRSEEVIPRNQILFLVFIGVADFISAFFFGFTSSPTPLQLFFPEVPNQIMLFPTGMIPLFLVPYAIFFHTLSALNYLMHDRENKQVGQDSGFQMVNLERNGI